MIIFGRSDATLNPGGVRIGTAEIYRQVEYFEEVTEALVVGQRIDSDQRIVLFVRLATEHDLTPDLIQKIKLRIRQNTSPRHVPSVICSVTDIPRTRSGKICELAVRDVLEGKPVPNTAAMANPEALEQFRDRSELMVS
jgi:acetoacetyl-CoA synthetase